eukprot:4847260-Amphidinium_carterae.2
MLSCEDQAAIVVKVHAEDQSTYCKCSCLAEFWHGDGGLWQSGLAHAFMGRAHAFMTLRHLHKNCC